MKLDLWQMTSGDKCLVLNCYITNITNELLMTLWIKLCPEMYYITIFQADYEQELAVQKAAHRRELAESREKLDQALAAAESKNLQQDQDSIKKKYTKEMDRIKVVAALI